MILIESKRERKARRERMEKPGPDQGRGRKERKSANHDLAEKARRQHHEKATQNQVTVHFENRFR